MRNSRFLIVLSISYFIFVYIIFKEFNALHHNQGNLFLDQSLFRVQKFLFNINIFFVAYIFILKLPITTKIFIVRCKEYYVSYLLEYGLKISLIFVLYIVLVPIIILVISNNNIIITLSLVMSFIKLFVFTFYMFFLYIWITLISGKQMMGIIGTFAVNLILLLFYYVLKFSMNINLPKEIWMNSLITFSSITSLVCILLVYYKNKFKDYLL
ncbi:hypothetical protein D3Z33_08600 [Senegalia massiliensis]|uniref:Uncharacterized protein n=1 Tax=Senegalia massiliensis TaxID=1720316 RepID=A0A845QXA6_9CLOT|nr:hypothetical protein [Senegalia massiliensis]